MQKLKGKMGAICDVTIFVLTFVYVAMIRAGKKQGFYCDDKSISYPKTEESLTFRGLVTISVLLGAVVILIIEVFVLPGAPERPLRMRIRHAVHVYVAYVYCHVYGSVFVVIIKASVGELRPHFLDVCKPDFSKINCSVGYITEFNCTSGASVAMLLPAYTSFPSGHATSAFTIATFLILYMQKHLDGRPTPLTVSVLHLALLAFATVISIRRIAEHQHHWWDVVAGVIIGVVVAVYGFNFFLSKADGTIVAAGPSQPKPPENSVEDPFVNDDEMQGILQVDIGK